MRASGGQGGGEGGPARGGSIEARLREVEARLRAVEEERDAFARREADMRRKADAGTHAQAMFMSLVSHELRTPLNAIVGYIELLRLQLHGPLTEEQAANLAYMSRSADQMLGLVTDLLALSRMTRGDVRPRLASVELRALCASVDGIGASLALRKGLTYEREDCEGGVVVRADQTFAEQVVRNLLSNAVKFTHAPGCVTRACRVEGEVVHIEVRDTGRGIAADHLEAIFEPFVQIDPGEFPERQRGVGVGLAVSRQLARLMGGDLTVTSTLGVGSVFDFCLPLAAG
jgi:signal transduction histidine kinase